MTPKEFIELANSVTYKPGWELTADEPPLARYSGMVRFMSHHMEPDPLSGEMGPVVNQQTIDPDALHLMSRGEAIEWIRVFLMGAETHELNEHLKVGGKHVTDPHPELNPYPYIPAPIPVRR